LLFVPDFIFFVIQWHSHPIFIKIVDVFDLYTPQNQNVHCLLWFGWRPTILRNSTPKIPKKWAWLGIFQPNWQNYKMKELLK